MHIYYYKLMFRFSPYSQKRFSPRLHKSKKYSKAPVKTKCVYRLGQACVYSIPVRKIRKY